MVALLDFINSYLEIVFGRKKLLGANGLFGDNVIKNPARYIYRYRYRCTVPQVCFSFLTYFSTVLIGLHQGEWLLQASHTIIT